MRLMVAAVAPLIALAAPASANDPAMGVIGTWLNPHSSVAVRTAACDAKLCGWVVWASEQARADARDGGTASLIGTKLLEDYRPRPDGSWSGTVYVPDMGHRFASTITQTRADRLTIKGCLIRGLFCRSQIWSRIGQLPNG